jgi:hypothetical protein
MGNECQVLGQGRERSCKVEEETVGTQRVRGDRTREWYSIVQFKEINTKIKSEKRREVSKIAEREARIDLEVEECMQILNFLRYL